VILPELLSDNLSNVLRIFLIIASVTENDFAGEKKIVHRKQSHDESQKALRKVTIVMLLQMRW
jgi:hypothetical protein